MEEVTLIKDIAVIMVTAGVITLLFRKLRQPPVLGYLLAGLLIGPYVLPSPPVTDLHTISLLADLGLVLLLFGLGLEFSWSKIRQVGVAVLLIGVIEIATMVYLGYWLGRLLGWPTMDSIFLGAALHISSSAIIVKILRDSGKLERLSSRIIVGILVVEDFAAVIIITVLSGVAGSDTAGVGDVGSVILKLVVFVAASLVLGAIVVPRVVRFTHQFGSKEALLITALALCFAMALIGKYLGLSVAAGAFLMGALIGDTEHSEEVENLVVPIRDMFAAIFFVAIGMLIDITQIGSFIVPAVIVALAFMVGKMLGNTTATFVSGHDGRTALEVGMGMPQMGEFSLAIAKLGLDRGVVTAPLYPVIALVTALTSLASPYISRSTDWTASLLERRSPSILREYTLRVGDWLQALRAVFAYDSPVARRVKHSARMIVLNLVIVMVIIGVGTFSLKFIEDIDLPFTARTDILALFFSIAVLVLCVPSFVVMWRSLQSLADEAVLYVIRKRKSAKWWSRDALRVVLRDSVLIVLTVFVAMWFVPLFVRLFSVGSYAMIVPVLVAAVVLYLMVRSIREIHLEMERTFSRVLLGREVSSGTDGLSKTAQGGLTALARRLGLWHPMRARGRDPEGESPGDSDKGDSEGDRKD